MSESRWYDGFAPLYDFATLGDSFYRKPRRLAVELLKLSRGDCVVDVFCGTGVDFPLLTDRIGDAGSVLAVDGSERMLERAKARAAKCSSGARFDFLQADFSQPRCLDTLQEALQKPLNGSAPRHIFFSLGLICLNNWRACFSLVVDASPRGTRFSIMDVYSDRLTVGARFINWIGAADCRRPVWRVLEERCEAFEWQEFRPFKVLDVSVFVAAGRKP